MVHCHATHVFTPELCIHDGLTFDQQIDRYQSINILNRFENVRRRR